MIRSSSASHDDGDCAVTGGYVYRGTLIPNLVGGYVYGDFCVGKLLAVAQSGGTIVADQGSRADGSAAVDVRRGSAGRDLPGVDLGHDLGAPPRVARQELERLVSDPFAPAALGPVTLRNRVIKAATFEGRTPKRVVTPELDRVPPPVRGRRRRA